MRRRLRWSKDALVNAAYEITNWYLGILGENIYSDNLPPEWKGMTPAEAGRNAVKMMLYYALNRSPNLRKEQRAIALYNAYCFGYTLGMNFRDINGHREMLWYEDLQQILEKGLTKYGSKIWS